MGPGSSGLRFPKIGSLCYLRHTWYPSATPERLGSAGGPV